MKTYMIKITMPEVGDVVTCFDDEYGVVVSVEQADEYFHDYNFDVQFVDDDPGEVIEFSTLDGPYEEILVTDPKIIKEVKLKSIK